jgi:hypothetical protein
MTDHLFWLAPTIVAALVCFYLMGQEEPRQ